jgi:hypothetical protein
LPAGLFRGVHHFCRFPLEVAVVGPGILPPHGLLCDAIALPSVTRGRCTWTFCSCSRLC